MSKIQSWELFTTQDWLRGDGDKLCEICQRYNLESYSQRWDVHVIYVCVVWDMSKIQSWELFTTYTWCNLGLLTLCEICQRYNLESYSQRINGHIIYTIVVWDMSKIQSWELFTTYCSQHTLAGSLCEICQRYNLESYSQQTGWTMLIIIVVWDMSKIQSWELFTTDGVWSFLNPVLCEICQRYNLESYSQHLSPEQLQRFVVWDMSKIQSWELFTTGKLILKKEPVLCEICQRYNLESYSQPNIQNYF